MTLRQADPELDDVLGVLGSCDRREILYQLEDAETDVVQFDALVDAQLAGNPDATDREAIAANLHHAHLSKLDEVGWVEYDFQGGTVRYRPDRVPTAMLSFLRTTEASP